MKLLLEAVRIWLPLLISICAISLTIFQALHTRKHSRLSVQPRIGFVFTGTAEGVFSVDVTNDGFGPAVITRLLVRFGGTDLGQIDLAACAELDRLFGRDGEAWETGCFVMDEDYVLRAGAEALVYESRPAPGFATDDWREKTIAFEQLEFNARYCSFYDECWWVDPPT